MLDITEPPDGINCGLISELGRPCSLSAHEDALRVSTETLAKNSSSNHTSVDRGHRSHNNNNNNKVSARATDEIMFLSLLAKRCNCIASSDIVIRCRLSVCRLSETRVYCDKTAEDRNMQFLLKWTLKCSPVP